MKEEGEMRNQEKDEADRYLQTYKILDRRHVHDEELLINRTGNFMLVNSFLLIAFATLVANGIWFSYVFPIAGIVICGVFYPLLEMQLKTARLWLKIQDEMERAMINLKVFPATKKAPNQRHKKMTKESPWMLPAWRWGPTILVTIMLVVWIVLLKIAC